MLHSTKSLSNKFNTYIKIRYTIEIRYIVTEVDGFVPEDVIQTKIENILDTYFDTTCSKRRDQSVEIKTKNDSILAKITVSSSTKVNIEEIYYWIKNPIEKFIPIEIITDEEITRYVKSVEV